MDQMAMTLGGRAAEARLQRGDDRSGERHRAHHLDRQADDHALRDEREARPARARSKPRHAVPRTRDGRVDYSEEIAKEIDDEIRRVIEEAHDKATTVLREHMNELHRLRRS